MLIGTQAEYRKLVQEKQLLLQHAVDVVLTDGLPGDLGPLPKVRLGGKGHSLLCCCDICDPKP